MLFGTECLYCTCSRASSKTCCDHPASSLCSTGLWVWVGSWYGLVSWQSSFPFYLHYCVICGMTAGLLNFITSHSCCQHFARKEQDLWPGLRESCSSLHLHRFLVLSTLCWLHLDASATLAPLETFRLIFVSTNPSIQWLPGHNTHRVSACGPHFCLWVGPKTPGPSTGSWCGCMNS